MYRLTNKYSRKIVAGLAGLTVGALSAAALAATGTDNASEDTLVSIIIPQQISITKLDPIDFGTWDLAGNERQRDNLCVWTNIPGGYTVNITSSTSAFYLDNTATATDIPFTVSWANQSGQNTGTAITYDTPTPFTLSAPTTANCEGGNNTSLVVDIDQSDLAAAEADAAAYEATLTVLVAVNP